MPGIEVWNEFDHDPRVAANAAMRASDRDRGVVASVLADAFAEGRLNHEEYDERADLALSSRTLGDLMSLVSDLPVASAPRTNIAEAAQREYTQDRRRAIWVLLSASLICWVVWLASGFGNGVWTAEHPWPLYVMLGTGLNAGRVVWQKNETLERETRRLEKKERKALEKRQNPLD